MSEPEHRPTFSQREGLASVPPQLRPKQINQALRALLFAPIHKDFETCVHAGFETSFLTGRWHEIMRDVHVEISHKMANTYDNGAYAHEKRLEDLYANGTYDQVLEFTEWLLRNPNCKEGLRAGITAALIKSRSAYRVVGGDTIVQITDENEGAAVTGSLTATATDFPGAHAHIKQAAKELRDGHYAPSMRESIHAVEAVLLTLEPDTEGFAAALGKLGQKFEIHGALRAGFAKLYGFTSDEKGIRHSLGDIAEADVDEADAIYMLGACASFVSYLIAKHRKASG